MTWTCDGKFIKDSLEDIGESVTVQVIATTTFNKHGDATVTYTDSIITAVITMVSSSETMEFESQFSTGEKIIITAGSNEALIATGNRIVHDGITYEIDRVMKFRTAGITYLVEAPIRKLN